ncbi:hypothetical protein IHE29_16570 (plasmid) [Mycetohabitans rhizoxinica]|uniref:Transposase n=1 Tax=Mycetohabitans rhizoxinica TaxID=412963 RepID=A0ABZ2Q055_9BURK
MRIGVGLQKKVVRNNICNTLFSKGQTYVHLTRTTQSYPAVDTAVKGFHVNAVDQAHVRFIVPPAFLTESKSMGVWLATAGTTATAFIVHLELGIAVVLCELLSAWYWLRRLKLALSESRFSISTTGIVWYGVESEPIRIAMHRINRVCLVSPSGRRAVLLSLRATPSEPQASPRRLCDPRHQAKWCIVVEADGLDYAIVQGLYRHTAIRLARAMRRALRVVLRDGYRT